jgi:hypothetical protein
MTKQTTYSSHTLVYTTVYIWNSGTNIWVAPCGWGGEQLCSIEEEFVDQGINSKYLACDFISTGLAGSCVVDGAAISFSTE